MLNTSSHIFAAVALTAMAFIIHVTIRNDSNTKALDLARFYTMTRERGDVSSAKALLDGEDKWLTSQCKLALNTTTLAGCAQSRRDLRDGILSFMKCFAYSSQVCNYLRNLTSALVQNRTYGATTYYVGKGLAGTVPGQGALTYRQLLLNALDNAPLLFHNSFRAAQSDDFYVARTALYTLVSCTILANLLVHYFDQFTMSWSARLLTRTVIFVAATLLPMIIFLASAGGSAFILFIGVWLPALVILLYFEAFLDATITRPWCAPFFSFILVSRENDRLSARRVHPFTFAIVYTSVSILALTENDVLNASVVGVAVAQAIATSFIYLQVVWYWVGYTEKKDRVSIARTELAAHAAELYTTKEMQYALFLALVWMVIFPVLQTTGPFDYNTGDLFVRGSPLVFLFIAVAGTLYIQSMQLGSHYGKDAKATPSFDTDKQKLVYHATRITGGKLAVSLLLIGFGALFEFNIVGEYFRGLRAYSDKLPERAWQFDMLSKYTIGTGFLPAASLYL